MMMMMMVVVVVLLPVMNNYDDNDVGEAIRPQHPSPLWLNKRDALTESLESKRDNRAPFALVPPCADRRCNDAC